MKSAMMMLIPQIICCLVAVKCARAQANEACVFSVQGLTRPERVMVETLQGIVNRKAPRLFLITIDEDKKWQEIYTEKYNFTFTSIKNLNELLEKFKDDISGLALYDTELDAEQWVAVTLAGVKDLLPVTEDIMSGKSPGQKKDLQEEYGFKIVEDLRGRWANNADPYKWALKELMPKCSKKVCHNIDAQYLNIKVGVCGVMWGFDYSVMQKGFVFNLSPSPRIALSYGNVEVGGYPQQTALFREILKSLDPPAQVNGYGEPEDVYCSLLSQYGVFSFHAFNNWSFHTRVKPLKKELKQKFHFAPANTKLHKKFYVSFLTSEGDTMKPVIPFAYGAWFNPLRGSVPINWGVNPIMAEQFPAMLEYYYQNATDEDYFFAGCSGAGYVYPNLLPDVKQFADYTGRMMRLADISIVDIWGGNNPEVLEEYARAAKPEGFTHLGGPARIKMLSNGTPVIFHELCYWQENAKKDLIEKDPGWRNLRRGDKIRTMAEWLTGKIKEIAEKNEPPFFITVYGDLHGFEEGPDIYKQVMDSLDPGIFKVARLDEMVSAAKLANAGKVLVEYPKRLFFFRDSPLSWDARALNLQDRAESVKIMLKGPGIEQFGADKEVLFKPWDAKYQNIRAEMKKEKGDADVILSYNGKKEERTIPYNIIDVRGDGSAAFMLSYSALDLSRQGGRKIEDPDSVRGDAWMVEGGDPCHIIYGPYESLPDGKYIALFRLKAEKRISDVVCVLDVFYGGTGASHKATEVFIKGTDLKEAGKYQWFAVPFDWVSRKGLAEFRVYWTGKTAVAVDHVAVFSLK